MNYLSLSCCHAALLAPGSHTEGQVLPFQELSNAHAPLGKELLDLGWQPLQNAFPRHSKSYCSKS